MRRVLACLALIAASACANAQTPGDGPSALSGALIMAKPLTAPISDGDAVGTATLTEAPDGVLIRIELEAGALTPGWHGVHLHEKADCSDAAYKTAGAHVGHGTGKQHGLLNPAGPEFGDLPNLYAPAKAGGMFGAEMFSTLVTLSPTEMGGRAPLLDADGSALIIHARPDDHLTQPIGGAGDRVACAAIQR
jgi:superoxide dismutase, Cu-Zn family